METSFNEVEFSSLWGGNKMILMVFTWRGYNNLEYFFLGK